MARVPGPQPSLAPAVGGVRPGAAGRAARAPEFALSCVCALLHSFFFSVQVRCVLPAASLPLCTDVGAGWRKSRTALRKAESNNAA